MHPAVPVRAGWEPGPVALGLLVTVVVCILLFPRSFQLELISFSVFTYLLWVYLILLF